MHIGGGIVGARAFWHLQKLVGIGCNHWEIKNRYGDKLVFKEGDFIDGSRWDVEISKL